MSFTYALGKALGGPMPGCSKYSTVGRAENENDPGMEYLGWLPGVGIESFVTVGVTRLNWAALAPSGGVPSQATSPWIVTGLTASTRTLCTSSLPIVTLVAPKTVGTAPERRSAAIRNC